MNLRPGAQPSISTPRERRAFADFLSGAGREHIDVVVPRTQIRGRMRLLSRAERVRVKAAVVEYFEALKLPSTPTALSAAGLGEEWNLEFATHTLAIAVREPEHEGKALATLDEWHDTDDDQIDCLWIQYLDLRERLDPYGQGATLTAEERAAIEADAKKGEASLLMPFGSRRLALYLLTSAAPPAS